MPLESYVIQGFIAELVTGVASGIVHSKLVASNELLTSCKLSSAQIVEEDTEKEAVGSVGPGREHVGDRMEGL